MYAVQGYDAAQLLAIGRGRREGRHGRGQAALFAAMRNARIDSPRGRLHALRIGHNPVQNIYLREARGGENKVIGVAAEALADPGTGCKLA